MTTSQSKTHQQPRRPYQPDMLANGSPQLTVLRTTRARPLPITDEIETLPRIVGVKRHPRHWNKHGVVFLATVLLSLGCWLFWVQAVVPAWNWSQDQWHYGDARITQLDANVGHDGISHFIAEYYQGQIVVIEVSLRDPSVSHTYTLNGLMGASGTPRIELSLEDQNRDKKPNLLVQIVGTTFAVTLHNTGSAFTLKEG